MPRTMRRLGLFILLVAALATFGFFMMSVSSRKAQGSRPNNGGACPVQTCDSVPPPNVPSIPCPDVSVRAPLPETTVKRHAPFANLSETSQALQFFALGASSASPKSRFDAHDNSKKEPVFVIRTSTSPPHLLATVGPTEDGFVTPALHSMGVWEQKITSLIQRLLTPFCQKSKDEGRLAPVFIDVGANMGSYGFVGIANQCRGVLIEPQPRLVRLLHLTAAINPGFLDYTRIYPNAVSDQPGSLFISLMGNNMGGREIVSNCGDENPKCAKVDSISIDEIIHQIAMDDGVEDDDVEVPLMKIDCEGYESKVVRSARRLLSRKRNPVLHILMELNFHGKKLQEEEAIEMVEFLYENEFELSILGSNSWLPREKITSFVRAQRQSEEISDLYVRRKK